MHMDYYIIATHQEREKIISIRYILDLNDSRISYEKAIDAVVNDIKTGICNVFTATRNSDGTYKLGSEVAVRRDYITTVGNERSGDNLDNLPRF